MTLEVLPPEACRQLLREVSVGWLAHCTDDGVHLVPVNAAVHEEELVIRAGYGTKLTAAVDGRVLTFGAGVFDPGTRSGWSVTVSGPAHLVGDPLVNPGLPPADVWADLPQTVVIGLPLTTVTGRRVRADEARGDRG